MKENFRKLIGYCPRCDNKLIINNDFIKCTNCDYNLKNKNNIYISNSEYSEYNSLQNFSGTKLRERVKVEFSTSKYEYIIYEKFINNTLDKIGENNFILEIGAGDGRFTGLLLKNNFIIANDINYLSLNRFQETLSKQEMSKILFICTSFEDTPIFTNQIDVLVAIESFFYSNDRYKNILQQQIRNIKYKGYLIDSEPLKSSAILYSLLNNENIDNSLSLIDGIKKESLLNESVITSRVFSKKELNSIYKKLNLIIREQSGTPELISIIALLLSKKRIHLKDAKKILENSLFDYTDNIRCLISCLQVEHMIKVFK